MTWLSLKSQGIEYTLEPLVGGQWHFARYKNGQLIDENKKLLKTTRAAVAQARLLADVTDKKWVINL